MIFLKEQPTTKIMKRRSLEDLFNILFKKPI